MSTLYPKGPEAVPSGLTTPSNSYKKQAWLACFGLLLFIGIYFGLASWFGWTAYRLMNSAFMGNASSYLGVISGLPALFLSVFMFKALFFVKRGAESKDIELSKEQEPALFDFLYQLADDAGAPRPHKVYVSPRVNAAVFYDLSIFNFIFPAKKNLEIGLALVNVLNLGELKAVLAHEFGHFAQRSMKIGNWVYIAHQVAAHLVVQRDIFDRFLDGLSRFDLRIAWIGWIMRLVIWAIRSLMDSVFRIVVIAQRALSREMEFQADLVAVSLTGSDALVHALHKLNAADDAWDRSIHFASHHAKRGKTVASIFDLQSQIIGLVQKIKNDPSHGAAPDKNELGADFRMFEKAIASPPKMWATHPENFAREENAKRHYIPAQIDERSAWALFADPQALEKRIEHYIHTEKDTEAMSDDELAKALSKVYGKAYYHQRFKGVFLGRSIVRHTQSAKDLYDEKVLSEADIRDAYATLYPDSLRDDIARLNRLFDEQYTLEGINNRTLNVNGGNIRHRGKTIRLNQIPHYLNEIKKDIASAEQLLQEHDKTCRSVHISIASIIDDQWRDNLLGTIDILHYASHSLANIADVQGYLNNVVSVVMADKRVTNKERRRVVDAANEAHKVLGSIYTKADQVELGEALSKSLEVTDWQTALGEFNLGRATETNLDKAIPAIHSWLDASYNWLSLLQDESLEQLLKFEAYTAKCFFKHSKEAAQAPLAPRINYQYDAFTVGSERKRQTKLNLWERFYLTQGIFPSTLRLAVALAIIGGVIWLGQHTGESKITLYNGLANQVRVEIDGQAIYLLANESKTHSLQASSDTKIETYINGGLVESFEPSIDSGFGSYVYNIAGAAALIQWTEVYGDAQAKPDQYLGSQRWAIATADYLFEDAPESIEISASGDTREVLEGFGYGAPRAVLSYVESSDQLQQTTINHAIWDAANSRYVLEWIGKAADYASIDDIITQRNANFAFDINVLRLQQDTANSQEAYQQVCEVQSQASIDHPENIDLKYAAARCIGDQNASFEAFKQGADTYPQHPWFNYATALNYIGKGEYQTAERYMLAAIASSPQMREYAGDTALRLANVNGAKSQLDTDEIIRYSSAAANSAELHSGVGLEDSPYKIFSLIAGGQLEQAELLIDSVGRDSTLSTVLIAASDNAKPEMVAKALAIPANQLDDNAILIAWALAKREGRAIDSYQEQIAQVYGDNSGRYILGQLSNLKSGSVRQLENQLLGFDLETKGSIYAAAATLLGKSANRDVKLNANKMTFAYERPYFNI